MCHCIRITHSLLKLVCERFCFVEEKKKNEKKSFFFFETFLHSKKEDLREWRPEAGCGNYLVMEENDSSVEVC